MKTKKKTLITKRICAFLLLVSFFLPIARGCSKYEIPRQEDNIEQEAKEPLFSMEAKDPKKKYAYDLIALDTTPLSTDLLFLFFGYLWPIPFLFLDRIAKKNFTIYLLACSELCLCIGTIYLIIIFAEFEQKLMSGGYLAITSVSIYFFVSVFELFKGIFSPSPLGLRDK